MLSCSSALEAGAGVRIQGRTMSVARISAAKTRNTPCQGISASSPSASGGPRTCPAEPAAVTMASDMERFSALDARPTTASTTPNPVPAMPRPTSTS